ncbi:cytochrome P450 [Mycena vitilis]|nr:cytochrome P450 [Mycena vitilis]
MSLYVYCGATAAIAILLLQLLGRRGKLSLPRGPRKWPVIGNLLDMPTEREWETYMKWSPEYNSDIIHLNIAGTSIIVISSAEVANRLLRSAAYSDRPRMPMVVELMGWGFLSSLLKYGDHWRKHRRLFHRAFNAAAAEAYQPKERSACHELLRRLLRNPDNIMGHLRHMAGNIILSVAYGINVLPQNDPFVALAEEAIHTLVYAVVPGRFLVDMIPILKYVPTWFPGAGFKRKAKEWSKLSQAMIDLPFAETKRDIASGNAPVSFTSLSLSGINEDEDKDKAEELVKMVAGTMYAGGADTTVSALGTFFLAMLANPGAQKKAQAEIDSVVGESVLPDFGDRESLPYVSALVKEVFRWRSVAPLAMAHFLTVEDEYQGYRLPAGSIVLANAWAMSHDEAVYPDPYTFEPERFLLEGKLNPAFQDPDPTFGFGRRLCPGRHMAQASVWINVVSILATFDIAKAVGEDGQVIEPTHEYFSALVSISMPLPFESSVKPRSQRAVELIQSAANDDIRS